MLKCAGCMKDLEEGTKFCPYCGADQEAPQMANALRRNTILHGRYLVGNVIGKGGFGITYVGFDLTLERKVAIKEYYPSGLASRTNSYSNQIQWNITNDQEREQRQVSMERFLKEARRMAKLDSVPAVVRVLDNFAENETAYIVMDYVEGVTLKSYLLSNGVLTWDACLKLMTPIMDSLAVVHDKGFIHRDISPDNIMIQPDGTAMLLDLGAATDISANDGHASMVVVKNNFSAPEQYDEKSVLGSWTDVYALAATIYYSLSGKTVPAAMDRAFSHEPFNIPQELGLPVHAAQALQSALSMDVGSRIQNMRQFKEALSGGMTEVLQPGMAGAGAYAYSAGGQNGAGTYGSSSQQPGAGAYGSSSQQYGASEVPGGMNGSSQQLANGASGMGTSQQWTGGVNGTGTSQQPGSGAADVQPSGKKKLSKGAIIGIAVGVVAVIAIVVVLVMNSTVSSVAVASAPKKTTYYQGDYLDTTGMEIELTYATGRTSTTDDLSDVSFSEGELTKAGTQQVEFSYKGKTSKFSIEVVAPTITLTESNMSVYIGEAFMPDIVTDPEDAEISYSVDNESVLEFYGDAFKPVSDGVAVITVTLENGNYSCSEICTVSVETPDLEISESSVEVAVDSEVQIEASSSPSGTITWSSSDENIATVNDGLITGVAEGTATITAKLIYMGYTYTADCEVTVKEDEALAAATAALLAAIEAAEAADLANEAIEEAIDVGTAAKENGISLTTSSGALYYGDVVNNSREGYGIIYYTSGDYAGGQWSGDTLNGYGYYIWSDSEYYAGEFVNGDFEGYGVVYFEDGDVFYGQFSDDNWSGYGVYMFSDGSYFAGEWVSGTRNGYGILYDEDGNVEQSGLWVNGTYQG